MINCIKALLSLVLLISLSSCVDIVNFEPGTKNINEAGASAPPAPFISTWKVGDAGYGDGDLTITLPLRTGFNYNFQVDWGDGTAIDTITAWNQTEATHTYVNTGNHTVTMWGLAEAWYFNNAGDRNKIISVTDFGDLGWINLEGAFYRCTNMTSFAGGNTAAVTNMNSMFNRAVGLTSLDVSGFNTAAVTGMYSMFYGTSSLTSLDLSAFDTAAVTNMRSMFYGASSLTSLDLSGLDTSEVTDMRYMFQDASALTSLNLTNWDTTGNPSLVSWLLNVTATIYCNDPDNGGVGAPGAGTVNGTACN